MSNISEEIYSKIESETEVISAMPTNNKKNREACLEKINATKEEFLQIQKDILNEIKRRANDVQIQEDENNSEDIIKKIGVYERFKHLLNDYESTYQKMDLDRVIYNLKHFYKKNLDNVNRDILLCINKFAEVGIGLTANDFEYSAAVKRYMQVFFEEKNNDVNSDKIKDTFEGLYWECPELINQIELNIRYLYFQHKVEIDKYYNTEKEEFLSQFNLNAEEIKERYKELKKELAEETKYSKKEIIENFVEGRLSENSYNEAAMRKYYTRFIPADILDGADEKGKEDINANLTKLLNNIYEYKTYLKFKFVVDDILQKYKEKDSHKNQYEEIKKNINSKEKELLKISGKKQENVEKKKFLFFKKKAEVQEDMSRLKKNELLNEIKDLYNELDKEQIFNQAGEKLTDDSTIKDVLEFANSFYNYLVKCIIKNNPDILEGEIEEMINELDEFIYGSYNTIISNIRMLEERDIQVMIKDRYKLLNFNITKEDLDEGNLDSLISVLEDIKLGNYISKNNIDMKKLGDVFEYRKLINQK